MPTMQKSARDKNLDRDDMRRLSHTAADTVTAPDTVGAGIDRVARALKTARVHFGHGTDNARDEAAELVFFVAGLPMPQAALPMAASSHRAVVHGSMRCCG